MGEREGGYDGVIDDEEHCHGEGSPGRQKVIMAVGFVGAGDESLGLINAGSGEEGKDDGGGRGDG